MIFFIGILFFFELVAHATFQSPSTKPSGRKARAEEERETNAVSSGHYVLPETPEGIALRSHKFPNIYLWGL